MRRVLMVAALASTGCDKLLDLRVVPPAADAAAAADAADAFMPVIGCSPMSMLAADFDTGASYVLPLTVGSPVTNTATYSNGALVANLVDVGYFTAASIHHYDLRDSQLTVEVSDDGGIAAGNEFTVGLDARRQDYDLWFLRQGSDLVFKRSLPGTVIEVDRIPYDPVAHRFLRFAHRSGVTTWETSPTGGEDFIVRATASGLDWIDYMAFALACTRGAAEYKVMIHSINGGTPMGDACPIVQLTDDFETPERDLQWSLSTAYGGTLTQAGGDMTFALGTTGYNNITLHPSIRYDLHDSALALELPQVLDVTADQTLEVAVVTLDGSSFQLSQRTGMLNAQRPNGTLANSVIYNPTQHRWWRVRESMGTLYWDVAPDGVSYSVFGQVSNVTGLDNVSVRIGAVGYATVPSTAKIDNVNR